MKITAKCIPVDPVQPARDPLSQAARAISSGGLVVFPTRGLYGLAADAFNVDAVHRVFRAKGRSPDNPVLILIRHPGDLDDMVTAVPDTAKQLMQKIWPGGVTLVLNASRVVPAVLTAGSGKIGIRLPAHPVARSLAEAVGGPITGTSANVSGRPGCSVIETLDAQIAGSVDLILDAGLLAGGVGSTVVDVTRKEPVILRHGVITEDIIQKALNPD